MPCICDGPGYCQQRDTLVDATAFRRCTTGTPDTPATGRCCVYLGNQSPERETPDARPVYPCVRHEQCTVIGPNNPYASCPKCKDRLTTDDPAFVSKFVDPLHVIDRHKNPTTALRDHLNGRSVFLACGGPSANDLPLERLNDRGSWVLSVNNMAGHVRFRSDAFVCADPPSKFNDSIWMDPHVMKLVPIPKMKRRRGRLRHKKGNEFEPLIIDGDRISANQAPNVWGFERRGWLSPDATFFLNQGAAWGNHDAGVKRTGNLKTVCTMLLGIRLLYHMGVRRIFLVGVDFRMSPDRGYAFPQARDEGASKNNNAQFAIVGDWLSEMQSNGTFDRFGLEIYNCFDRSGLRAFGHVPFDDALADVCRGVDQEPDLSGWYEK